MKKVVLTWIFWIVVGCQIARAQEKTSLRVGYVPLINQLPLIVSYAKDHLNFTHIDLELTKYTSFTSLEAAVRVGAIDAASLPVPIALSIAADSRQCESCRIMIIGAIQRGGSMLVVKASGGLENLQDTLIGVSGLDTAENLRLKEALSTNNLRFGLDYKTIAVPFDSGIKYLRTGKLGALYLPEPFGTLAEQEQLAFAVEGQKDQLTGNLETVLVIHSDMLKIHFFGVEEWLISLFNSCRFIEHDLQHSGGRQTARIQSSYFGYPEEIVTASLSQRRGDIRFQYFSPELEELQELMQLALEMKLIMKSVNWDTVISADLSKYMLK